MGTTWDGPPRESRRVIAMRFEVDEPDVDANPLMLERLAQAMEGYAIVGARIIGGVVRERRLFVDRRGAMHEIAPLEDGQT